MAQDVVKTINLKDDILGDLRFKEYKLDSTCKFDKKAFICVYPFNSIEIQADGNIYVCCPAWNPVVIGNILQEDLKSIWKGKRANILRESMIDTSFKYCQENLCPAMLAGHSPHIKSRDSFQDPDLPFPNFISLSIDNTCNLECPSCRIGKILSSNSENTSFKIIENVFKVIFEKPHNQRVLLTMDGSGEIFHSSIYRKIFEDLKDKDLSLWPNVKFVLCTNGTMLTPKIQNKYSYLLDKAFSYRFSIDAGNEQSYNIVRKGGDWNMLWDNINYLYENRIGKDKIHWSFNLILQKDNYESLPELIEIAKSYDNLPEIYITNILDWGVQSADIYSNMAIWLDSHPDHEKMKRVLNLPEVVNYPKMMKPF